MKRALLMLVVLVGAVSSSCADKYKPRDYEAEAKKALEDASKHPRPIETIPATTTTIDPAIEALKERLRNAEATAPYNACAKFAVAHVSAVTDEDAYLRLAPGYWETDKFSFAHSGSDGLVIKSSVTRGDHPERYECLVSREIESDRRNGYEIRDGFTLVAFESAVYTDGVVP